MSTYARSQFLLVICILVLVSTASAQMGIRYGLHYEKTTQAQFGSEWHMMLGWDFDHNERLSGGLDVSTDVRWGNTYDMPSSYSSGPTFYEKIKVIGVQYRSQFHVTDNDGGTSFYLGPTIGLRSVKHKINYDEEINNGFYYSREEVETEESAILFPVGLRLGVRGPLDGGYGDIFIAIGTNIGSGDEPINDVKVLKGESLPNKVFFQAGLCYGVGW